MDEFDEDDERNSSPDHHKPASESKWTDSSAPVTAVGNYVPNRYPATNNHPTQPQGYPGHYQVPQGGYNPNATGTFPQVEGTLQANLHAHVQEHIRMQQKPQVPSFPSEGSSGAYPPGNGTEDVRRAVVMQQNSTVHPSLNNSGMDVMPEQNLMSKATKSTALNAHHNTPAATANEENNETTKGTIITSSGPVVDTPATTHAVTTHQFPAHHGNNVTIVQLKQKELQYKYSQPAPTVPEQLVATTTAAVAKTNSSLGSETANVQRVDHVRMSSATTVEETTASEPQAAVGQHPSPIVDATTQQQDVSSAMRKTDDRNSASQGPPVSSPATDTCLVPGNANRPPETTDTATFMKNNDTALETTSNQVNDSYNIEMTKKTVAGDSGTMKLAQTNAVTNETVAVTAPPSVALPKFDQMKATSDASNLSTPKRLRNNDSAFTDDMYRQSPVANMSSVFATAMTSCTVISRWTRSPGARRVPRRVPEFSCGCPESRPSYPYGGPGGAGGGGTFVSHMMFPQLRASPARSPALSIGK